LHATIFDQPERKWLLPKPNKQPVSRKVIPHHKKRRRLPILHTLALLNAIHYLKTGEANVFKAIMAKHNYNDRKSFHRAGTISSIFSSFLILPLILTLKVQESPGDLLDDQGTVTTGPVINDDSNSLLPFDRLANQTDCILDHLRVQHPFQ
jgi:hypothetical protein